MDVQVESSGTFIQSFHYSSLSHLREDCWWDQLLYLIETRESRVKWDTVLLLQHFCTTSFPCYKTHAKPQAPISGLPPSRNSALVLGIFPQFSLNMGGLMAVEMQLLHFKDYMAALTVRRTSGASK